MNSAVKNTGLENKIFNTAPQNFEATALELFRFQYEENIVYGDFCRSISVSPDTVKSIARIPFLPIQFFKTHRITSTLFTEETIFESSGTTGTVNSKHFVRDVALYRKSFLSAFRKFYGAAEQYCIIGLLPSYLERKNSSLVMMVDELIQQSRHPLSGFYLDEYEKIHKTLLHNEILKQPTLLLGVTYALLDFAEQYKLQLKYTTVMETGGMKGRRKEMTRREVHTDLEKRLGLSVVHSEYGMTELLSQAYSKGSGFFHCSPWMKILIREEDDPLLVHEADTAGEQIINGVINIIDLANIYSCAFIATDDAGRLYPDNSFEVQGRIDHSDIRGCSLLTI
ncbi:MAG: acyl transferase [Ferruginibacter sp.]